MQMAAVSGLNTDKAEQQKFRISNALDELLTHDYTLTPVYAQPSFQAGRVEVANLSPLR